jgi:hypothetical protein
MRSILGWLTVALILTGCAGATASDSAQSTTLFTGEVWTWDEQSGIVTLRQGGQFLRVKAAPDQLKGLSLHATQTVRGVLAGPAEIQTFLTPPVPLMASGVADEMDANGTVASIDPAGKMTIDTQRGPVEVWVAQPTAPVVKVGESVRVKMRVQEMIPAPPGYASTPTALEPAASPTSEPGEYAVVRGRLLAVGPSGRLTIESPRGPITVLVPATAHYQLGNTVEVHTSVHPTH